MPIYGEDPGGYHNKKNIRDKWNKTDAMCLNLLGKGGWRKAEWNAYVGRLTEEHSIRIAKDKCDKRNCLNIMDKTERQSYRRTRVDEKKNIK